MEIVFAGFDYVGAFAAKLGQTSHQVNGRAPLPSELHRGEMYVFHLLKDFDFETLVCRLLPQRLQQIGATVTEAPKSGLDMAIPNFGNLGWGILFTFAGRQYELHNRVDMNRAGQFARANQLRHRPDARIDDYLIQVL